MNDIIMSILQPVLYAAGVILIGVVSKLAVAKIEEARNSTSNTFLASLLKQAENVVTDCVQSTNQTYVDAIKAANSTLSEAEAATALEKTKTSVLKVLSEDTIGYLKNAVGDFEEWLKTKIEAAVKESK